MSKTELPNDHFDDFLDWSPSEPLTKPFLAEIDLYGLPEYRIQEMLNSLTPSERDVLLESYITPLSQMSHGALITFARRQSRLEGQWEAREWNEFIKPFDSLSP